MEDKNF